MRMIPFQSSQIVGAAYESANHTLYVQFNNGTWYSYDDVPSEVVLSIILADSQGKAFDEKVKKGSYVYHKLDEEPDDIHV